MPSAVYLVPRRRVVRVRSPWGLPQWWTPSRWEIVGVEHGPAVERAGQASASVTIDTMLSPVLDVFGVADVSQLPSAVLNKYEQVKKTLLDVPGMSPDQLASAMGPALVNAGLAVFKGNPAAGVMMLYHAMQGIMATAGGPIGAAVAGTLDAVPAILETIGGFAHGAGDQCQQCSQGGAVWYGGWDISQHKAPIAPTLQDGKTPDPRWIRWDNQTTHGPLVTGSDGKQDGQCADDLPTVDMSGSGVGRWVCAQGANTGLVSGAFKDLTLAMNGTWTQALFAPWVPAGKITVPVPKGSPGAKWAQLPKDGFDYAFAQQLAMLLEQYMNAQGPRPVTGGTQQVGPNQWSSTPFGPGEMNLRDVIEPMVRGWNAIHDPGKPIQINRPYPVAKQTGGHYTGPNNTGFYVADYAPVPPGPDTDHDFWDPLYQTGDYARRYLLADPRSQDVPLMLNTGPLLQSIQDLFNMKPAAPKVVIVPVKMSALPPPKPTVSMARVASGVIGMAGVGMHLLPPEVAHEAPPPSPPPPSAVGLTALLGGSAALAFGMPWVAVLILGTGALVGAIKAWVKP